MKKTGFLPLLVALLLFAGCTPRDGFENPGDSRGGGGYVDNAPQAADSQTMEDAEKTAGETPKSERVPNDATAVNGMITISEAGDYVLKGEIDGKITVEAEGVRLFLDGATLTNEKKVIESAYGLAITLSGENSVANSNADGSNAIDCAGDLVINGSGSLSVTSTKNAVKGGTIAVTEATLSLTAAGDGLHAEIGAYDDLTEEPNFSYEDGGWVKIDGASLTVTADSDGIQADTFVLVKGDSVLDITTNGGAPNTITEQSSDSGSGKGVKAGAIDWGANGAELISDGYFIGIESGTVTVNANDDAIHSDGEILISGGTLDITAGDDAVHAESLLTVAGGQIKVNRCYEGLEAAKVEIKGGTVDVTSTDDGINGADGTSLPMGQANGNCHIILSGGDIRVNAEGDGVDSNGTILMTGGSLVVFGPTRSDNAALDADGGILINGGYLCALGPLGMVETPGSNSTQNVLSFAQNKSIAAGTNLSLTDADGQAILSVTTLKACQSVIFSCPELVTGKSFKVYGGDSELCSFTVSGTITSVGSSSGMGNPGGMPPGGFGGGHGGSGGGFGGRW